MQYTYDGTSGQENAPKNNRLARYFEKMSAERMMNVDRSIERMANDIASRARKKHINDIPLWLGINEGIRQAHRVLDGELSRAKCHDFTLDILDLVDAAIKADMGRPVMPYVSGRLMTHLARAIEAGRRCAR